MYDTENSSSINRLVKYDIADFTAGFMDVSTVCMFFIRMTIMQAWRSFEEGNIVQIIDQVIIEMCDETQVLRGIHVGFLCTQVESSCHPPMSKSHLLQIRIFLESQSPPVLGCHMHLQLHLLLSDHPLTLLMFLHLTPVLPLVTWYRGNTKSAGQ